MSRVLVMPRGINVGARNRVPMAELRAALEDVGFEDVVTILQSGNVIVTHPGNADADAVGQEVAAVIAKRFGVDVPCLTRSADELKTIATLDPLRDTATDGSKYLVTFLSEEPAATAVEEFGTVDVAPEVVHVHGREVYVWTPEGVKAMKHSYSALEKRFGCHATARNWNTLEKIVEKL